MSYASISGSQTEQRKPKERREERRVIAGIRERENEAAAEGRGARRPALRSAGRGSCRSGELGSGEADSCFVPASGALLPSVPSVSLLWLPSYGLHPKPSSLGGHHLAPKARNSGGHFLEAPMGDVASGARWTCSWGAGEAPVVISHLGPPPQSQGPPPGGGGSGGGVDVRDSLPSVSVCAQGKWTLVSTRKARAEARCGKVGRSRGRPRVPSAWTVCKTVQRENVSYVHFATIFFDWEKKKRTERQESAVGQGWAEEGGLPAARGQKGRKWGQGLTLHSPGPGKGGAGPGRQ